MKRARRLVVAALAVLLSSHASPAEPILAGTTQVHDGGAFVGVDVSGASLAILVFHGVASAEPAVGLGEQGGLVVIACHPGLECQTEKKALDTGEFLFDPRGLAHVDTNSRLAGHLAIGWEHAPIPPRRLPGQGFECSGGMANDQILRVRFTTVVPDPLLWTATPTGTVAGQPFTAFCASQLLRDANVSYSVGVAVPGTLQAAQCAVVGRPRCARSWQDLVGWSDR